VSAEHEQDQDTTRRVRAREVGLFRYGLIQDALDAGLSTKQRGRLVRALAARIHPGPFGPAPVRVSRASLDRWIRAYRAGGFTALVPVPRRLAPQTPPEVLELAVALKTEAPGRTAAQVAVVLGAHAGWAPSPRTLQRHFARSGSTGGAPTGRHRRCSAGSRPKRPTPAGSVTRCTARSWPGARRSSLPSWTITPGRWWRPAGGTPRPRWRWPRRCASAWPAVGAQPRPMWTTGRCSSTPGCAGRARCWASSSPIPSPGDQPVGEKLSGSSKLSGTSSWSRSPTAPTGAPRGPAPQWAAWPS